MSKSRLTLGVILTLSLAVANAWQYWLKPKPMAPELTFTTIKGDSLSLQQLQGKTVLVSFWVTSCALCLLEIDDLIALHNSYQAQGLTTLAVALSHDFLPAIQAMQANRKLPYTIVFDRNDEFVEAFGGVRMTPTHYLIDASGHIIWNNVGAIDH